MRWEEKEWLREAKRGRLLAAQQIVGLMKTERLKARDLARVFNTLHEAIVAHEILHGFDADDYESSPTPADAGVYGAGTGKPRSNGRVS